MTGLKAFLIWTVIELLAVALASSIWGLSAVYEWRTHNPWVAIPLLALVTASIWKGRRA